MSPINQHSAFDALKDIALPTTALEQIKGGEGEIIVIVDIIDI